MTGHEVDKCQAYLAMSALPPKADMCGATRDVRYGPIADSCTAANQYLFDHLAGAERQSWRDVQSNHVCGLEVDYQLILGRCLNRQFARLLAVQNAIGVGCSPSPLIDLIWPICHQPALGRKISERIDGWQAVPRRR